MKNNDNELKEEVRAVPTALPGELEIEVSCSICGEPLFLPAITRADVPDNSIGRRLREYLVTKLAPICAHDKCRDAKEINARERDQTELLHVKAQRWESLCPPLFHDNEFKRIPSKAKGKAVEWSFEKGEGLLLYGKSRVGKTRIAWFVIKREFDRGRFVVSMTHAAFSAEAVRLKLDDSKANGRWVRTLRMTDILFLDDLGKGRFTDIHGHGKYAEELLFDLLDDRMIHKRPCIFTTQDGLEMLRKRMSEDKGEGFVNRLSEHCKSVAM